jgi:hypothetical protein
VPCSALPERSPGRTSCSLACHWLIVMLPVLGRRHRPGAPMATFRIDPADIVPLYRPVVGGGVCALLPGSGSVVGVLLLVLAAFEYVRPMK